VERDQDLEDHLQVVVEVEMKIQIEAEVDIVVDQKISIAGFESDLVVEIVVEKKIDWLEGMNLTLNVKHFVD